MKLGEELSVTEIVLLVEIMIGNDESKADVLWRVGVGAIKDVSTANADVVVEASESNVEATLWKLVACGSTDERLLLGKVVSAEDCVTIGNVDSEAKIGVTLSKLVKSASTEERVLLGKPISLEESVLNDPVKNEAELGVAE